MARIGDGCPSAVGVEVIQSNIYANCFTCRGYFLNSFYTDAELSIVTIGSPDYPYPLNLIWCIEVQVTGTD
jgi:hypothetical protein